jgi:hypothetical protein
MSFGFSVGDFVAVGGLIVRIIGCLQEAGGAKSEYQELIEQLNTLHKAFLHLDRLHVRGSASSEILLSIKATALTCRHCLETFLAEIEQFDKSLGVCGKAGVAKTTIDKLCFNFGKKSRVTKLKDYLKIHIRTINILLVQYGFEALDSAAERLETQQKKVQETIEESRIILDGIQGNVAVQTFAMQAVSSTLTTLCRIVSGDFLPSWQCLVNQVTQTWLVIDRYPSCVKLSSVVTQQMYRVVLEIKANVCTPPNGRLNYFQAPLLLEDALGCKLPVPSEYDFSLIEAIIKQRFETGPGAGDVKLGNYEVFETNNSKKVITSNSRLLPGTHITMAVLVDRLAGLGDDVCPMPICGSDRTLQAPGGGLIW